MITEKEIMVGNLFIGYDDKIFTWSLGHFQILWCDVPIDDIIKSPIPISEEWLLKFGFKKRESGVCDSFYIGFNPVTHDWLFDLVWLKKMMDYSYEGNPFYKNGHHEVKYIHQLQNLYFALTQTELELK